jgi:hypothetical protein
MFSTQYVAPPTAPPTKLIAMVSRQTGRVIGLSTDVEEPPNLSEPVDLIEYPLDTRIDIGNPAPAVAQA